MVLCRVRQLCNQCLIEIDPDTVVIQIRGESKLKGIQKFLEDCGLCALLKDQFGKILIQLVKECLKKHEVLSNILV